MKSGRKRPNPKRLAIAALFALSSLAFGGERVSASQGVVMYGVHADSDLRSRFLTIRVPIKSFLAVPLKLSSAETSCECAAIESVPSLIQPNEGGAVIVKYDTNGKRGRKFVDVTVKDASKIRYSATISVTIPEIATVEYLEDTEFVWRVRLVGKNPFAFRAASEDTTWETVPVDDRHYVLTIDRRKTASPVSLIVSNGIIEQLLSVSVGR